MRVPKFPARPGAFVFGAGMGLLMLACRPTPRTLPPVVSAVDARAMVLVPVAGTEKIDEQIRACQRDAAANPNGAPQLEQLGRLFIAKARLSFDPGYYKLAEQCALLLETDEPHHHAARLLRGHALLALHRFSEAEKIARELVAVRPEVLEYALLGDALMEQGRLEEAVTAYQAMVDAKPCLPSYSRVAHLRWLKGDLEGAIEVMREAVGMGNYRDPEPLAWVTARLGSYQFQKGDWEDARRTADRAAELVPEYPPALLLRGRVLAAQAQWDEAIAALREAASRNPLPEYQWTLADTLRGAGQTAEAEAVEAELQRTGAARDPRTFALYLATRREQPEQALALAQNELQTRQDVFSYDALAWAQWAAGQFAPARANSLRAVSAGTADAHLFFHAGLIAQSAGELPEAARWLEKARALEGTLLCAERHELQRRLSALGLTDSPRGQTTLAEKTNPQNP